MAGRHRRPGRRPQSLRDPRSPLRRPPSNVPRTKHRTRAHQRGTAPGGGDPRRNPARRPARLRRSDGCSRTARFVVASAARGRSAAALDRRPAACRRPRPRPPRAAIPDGLAMGPDPQAPATPTPDGLAVDDGMRWMVDFDVAVTVGMALRIPLDPVDVSLGFDRVLAYGLRASSTSAPGPSTIADLLDAIVSPTASTSCRRALPPTTRPTRRPRTRAPTPVMPVRSPRPANLRPPSTATAPCWRSSSACPRSHSTRSSTRRSPTRSAAATC